MPWTEITREQYRRDDLRFASDMKDAEWLLLSFFLPAACRVGRPREVELREVMNAILYILATGCQWRALPKEFPPRSTVQYYFYLWLGKHTDPAVVPASDQATASRDAADMVGRFFCQAEPTPSN